MKLGIVFSFVVLISCGGSKIPGTPTAESKALDEVVASRYFIIALNWASPRATSSMNAIANSGLLGNGNTGGHIHLSGNPNYLKIEGDTITADLPYYGERQMGGGYNKVLWQHYQRKSKSIKKASNVISRLPIFFKTNPQINVR